MLDNPGLNRRMRQAATGACGTMQHLQLKVFDG
jgi:hypothetical protein